MVGAMPNIGGRVQVSAGRTTWRFLAPDGGADDAIDRSDNFMELSDIFEQMPADEMITSSTSLILRIKKFEKI